MLLTVYLGGLRWEVRELPVWFCPGDSGILYKAFPAPQDAWESDGMKKGSASEEVAAVGLWFLTCTEMW